MASRAWFAVALLLAGCDGGGSEIDAGTDAGVDAGPTDPPGFAWTDCYGGLRCATLEVPQDYAEPDGTKETIAFLRAPARRPALRIGTLFFNTGGPGAPVRAPLGGIYAQLRLLAPELTDRFDIIGFDPRGIGESTPAIECISDAELDRMRAEVDLTPDDATERAAFDTFAASIVAGCRASHDDAFLATVHTENVARDMDALREALGEERIHYYGVSYGTYLGAMYMTLFPDRVGAFVLDSAVEPDRVRETRTPLQTAGYEDSLERFLADCAADTACPFRADGTVAGQQAAWDALYESLDGTTVPAGPRMATQNDLGAAALFALRSGSARWTEFAAALADAQAGDGTGLISLADEVLARGETGVYGNFLEAYVVIYALDFPLEAADSAAFEAFLVSDVDPNAPRMGRPIASLDRLAIGWPIAPIGATTNITAPSAPPALILAGTHDPATPREEALMLQSALGNGSYLVTNDGDGHQQIGIGACALDAAIAFLLDPSTPPTTIDCSAF